MNNKRNPTSVVFVFIYLFIISSIRIYSVLFISLCTLLFLRHRHCRCCRCRRCCFKCSIVYAEFLFTYKRPCHIYTIFTNDFFFLGVCLTFSTSLYLSVSVRVCICMYFDCVLVNSWKKMWMITMKKSDSGVCIVFKISTS